MVLYRLGSPIPRVRHPQMPKRGQIRVRVEGNWLGISDPGDGRSLPLYPRKPIAMSVLAILCITEAYTFKYIYRSSYNTQHDWCKKSNNDIIEFYISAISCTFPWDDYTFAMCSCWYHEHNGMFESVTPVTRYEVNRKSISVELKLVADKPQNLCVYSTKANCEPNTGLINCKQLEQAVILHHTECDVITMYHVSPFSVGAIAPSECKRFTMCVR